jgi:hypothetical protein
MNDSIGFPLNLLIFGGPDLLQQGYLVGGTQSDRSTAPYLRLTYDITDQASVILGARYTYEKKDLDQTSQFDRPWWFPSKVACQTLRAADQEILYWPPSTTSA